MKFPAAKLLATVTCSLTLLGVAAVPSEACCFLSGLFGGCCGSRYGSCYAPSCAPAGCSTGACGSTAYYAPNWGCSPCGSACAPCSTGCSPCGTSCSPCASGDCAVSSAAPAASATPTPANQNWQKKKTYAEPENGTNGTLGSPGNLGAPASGNEPAGGTRTKPDGFREDDDSTTGFKPPTLNGNSDIQQAGGEEPGDSVPVKPRDKKKSPAAPQIPDDDAESGTGHLPTLNFDEKIAWRAAPERKRVEIKARTAQARLTRVPAYPKSEWVPVGPESKVAKK